MTLLEVFEPLKRFANVKLLSHQDLRHIVRMAYLGYLDREPDPEGVKNYPGSVASGWC